MASDAVRLDAQIRAFATALRAVHKSDSWEYVAPLAAQAWATLDSVVEWVVVSERVQARWADIGSRL